MAVWKKHPILHGRISYTLWDPCGRPSVSAFPPAARPRPICPSVSAYHPYFSTPPETDELWLCPSFGSAPQWLHQHSMENEGPTFSTLATLLPERIEIDIFNLNLVNRGAYDTELWLSIERLMESQYIWQGDQIHINHNQGSVRILY